MAGKAELVRFARGSGGMVVLDAAGVVQGRGAYVCAASHSRPDSACLDLAVRRGGIWRTLRCSEKTEITDLVESVSR